MAMESPRDRSRASQRDLNYWPPPDQRSCCSKSCLASVAACAAAATPASTDRATKADTIVFMASSSLSIFRHDPCRQGTKRRNWREPLISHACVKGCDEPCVHVHRSAQILQWTPVAGLLQMAQGCSLVADDPLNPAWRIETSRHGQLRSCPSGERRHRVSATRGP